MEYNPLLLTLTRFGGQRVLFTGVSVAGKTRIFKKLLFDYLSVNRRKRFILVLASKDDELETWKEFFGENNPYVTIVPNLFKENEKGKVVENKEVLFQWANRNKATVEARAIEKLIIVDDQVSEDDKYDLKKSSFLSKVFNTYRTMNFTVFLMSQRRVSIPTGFRSQATININLKEDQSGEDRANTEKTYRIAGQLNGKPTLYATMMTALVKKQGWSAGKACHSWIVVNVSNLHFCFLAGVFIKSFRSQDKTKFKQLNDDKKQIEQCCKFLPEPPDGDLMPSAELQKAWFGDSAETSWSDEEEEEVGEEEEAYQRAVKGEGEDREESEFENSEGESEEGSDISDMSETYLVQSAQPPQPPSGGEDSRGGGGEADLTGLMAGVGGIQTTEGRVRVKKGWEGRKGARGVRE